MILVSSLLAAGRDKEIRPGYLARDTFNYMKSSAPWQ